MAINGDWLSTHVHLYELGNFCGSARKNEVSNKSEISVLSALPSSKDANSLSSEVQESVFHNSKVSNINPNNKSDESVLDCFRYELARMKSEICLSEGMFSPLSPLPPTPPHDDTSSLDAFFDECFCNDQETKVRSQGINENRCSEGVIFSDMGNEHIQNVCEASVLWDEMFNEPPKLILSAFDNFMDSSTCCSELVGCSQQSSMHSERISQMVHMGDKRDFDELDNLLSATLYYDDETQTSSMCIESINNVSFCLEVHDDGTLHLNWPGAKHEINKTLNQPCSNSFPGCNTVLDSGVYCDRSTEYSQHLKSCLEKADTSPHGKIKIFSSMHKKCSKLFVVRLQYNDEVQTSSLCIDAVNKVPVSCEACDDGTLYFSWCDAQYDESTHNTLCGVDFSAVKRKRGSKTNSVLKCTVSPGDSVILNRLPLKTHVKRSESNKSAVVVEPSICKVSHSSYKTLNNTTGEKTTIQCSDKCSETDSVSKKTTDSEKCTETDSVSKKTTDSEKCTETDSVSKKTTDSEKCTETNSVSKKITDSTQSEKQDCSGDIVQVMTRETRNVCGRHKSSEQLFIADSKSSFGNKITHVAKNYSDITEFSTDILERSSDLPSKRNVSRDYEQLDSFLNIGTVMPSISHKRLKVSECNKQNSMPVSVSCKSDTNVQCEGSLHVDSMQMTSQKNNLDDELQCSEKSLVPESRSFVDEQLLSKRNSESTGTGISDVSEAISAISEQNKSQDDLHFQHPTENRFDSFWTVFENYCVKGRKQVSGCNTEVNGDGSLSGDENMQSDKSSGGQIMSRNTINILDEHQTSVQLVSSKKSSSGIIAVKMPSEVSNYSCGVHRKDGIFVEQNIQQGSHFQNPLIHSSITQVVENGAQNNGNRSTPCELTTVVQSEKFLCINSSQMKSHEASNVDHVQQSSGHQLSSKNVLPFSDGKLTGETESPSEVNEFSIDGKRKNSISLEENLQQNDQYFQNCTQVCADDSSLQNYECHILKDEIKISQWNKQDNMKKLASCESNKDLQLEKAHVVDSLQTVFQGASDMCSEKKSSGHQLSSTGESSYTRTKLPQLPQLDADVYERYNVEKEDQHYEDLKNISTVNSFLPSTEQCLKSKKQQASEVNKQDSRTKLSQKSKKEVQLEKTCVTVSLQHMSEKTNSLYDHCQLSGQLHLENSLSFAKNKERSGTEFGVTECGVGMCEREKKKQKFDGTKHEQCSKTLSLQLKRKIQCDKPSSSNSSQVTDDICDQQQLSGLFLDLSNVESSFVWNKKNDTVEQQTEMTDYSAGIVETASAVMKQNTIQSTQCSVGISSLSSELKLKKKIKQVSGNCQDNYCSSSVRDDIPCESPRKKQKLDEGKYKQYNGQHNGTTLPPKKSNKNEVYQMSNSSDSLRSMYEKMMASEQLCIVKPGSSCYGIKERSIKKRKCEVIEKNCVHNHDKSNRSFQKDSDHSSALDVSPNSKMKIKKSSPTIDKKETKSGINFCDINVSSSGSNSCKKTKIQEVNGKNHKQSFVNQQTFQEDNILTSCVEAFVKETIPADVGKTGNLSIVAVCDLSPGKPITGDKETTTLDNSTKTMDATENLDVTVDCDRDTSVTVEKKKKREKRKKQVKVSDEVVPKHGNSSHPNSLCSTSERSANVPKNLMEKYSSFEQSWRNNFFHLGQKNLDCNAGLKKCLIRLEKVNETHERFHNLLKNQFTSTILNPATVLNVKQGVSTIINHFYSSSKNPLENAVYTSGNTNLPLMPLSEQYVIDCLFFAQEKNKPHLQGIIPAILSMILGKFFQRSKLQRFGFAALCRLYTAIYKKLDFLPGPQLLCRDILIKCSREAPYLIASVAGVWPEVLQFQDIIHGVHNPLNLAVPYLLLKPFGGRINNLSARDFNALISLTRMDFHAVSSLTLANLIKKIFQDFSHCDERGSLTEGDVTQYLKAVELLCERHTWKWAVEVVVLEAIYPFLNRWIKKHQPGHDIKTSVAVIAVFRLLGLICHRVSSYDKTTTSSVMKKLETFLTSSIEKEIPFVVQEAAFVTLISLKSDGKELEAPPVQSWAKKNMKSLSSDAKKLQKVFLRLSVQSEVISRHFSLDTCGDCLESSWWSHYCIL